MIPPRRSKYIDVHCCGAGPGPSPNVPVAKASVDAAIRHSAPERNGRSAGSAGRMTVTAPAADETDRRRVGDVAAEPAAAAQHRGAGAPAVPAQVERERKEDAGADDGESDQIDVVLLERRNASRHNG